MQLYVQGHEVAHLDHPRTQMCTCLAQSSDVDGGLEHAGVITECLDQICQRQQAALRYCWKLPVHEP